MESSDIRLLWYRGCVPGSPQDPWAGVAAPKAEAPSGGQGCRASSPARTASHASGFGYSFPF